MIRVVLPDVTMATMLWLYSLIHLRKCSGGHAETYRPPLLLHDDLVSMNTYSCWLNQYLSTTYVTQSTTQHHA